MQTALASRESSFLPSQSWESLFSQPQDPLIAAGIVGMKRRSAQAGTDEGQAAQAGAMQRSETHTRSTKLILPMVASAAA